MMRALVAPGRRSVLAGALALGALGGALIVTPSPAAATTAVTLYVNAASGTKTAGCGGWGATACTTIQEGVSAAEALTGETVKVEVAAGTYSGAITIAAGALSSLSVTGVTGTSTAITKVTGKSTERDFEVSGGTVTLSRLSIDHGYATDGAGAEIMAGANVTVNGDTFSTDTALTGGGVANDDGSTVTVTDSTFTGDRATNNGGALDNESVANLTNVTIASDSATEAGGGVYNTNGTITVRDVTFFNNAAARAGGVDDNNGTAVMTASVFDDSSCRLLLKTKATFSTSYDVTTTSVCTTGSGSATDKTVTASALVVTPVLKGNTTTGPETLAIGPASAAFELVPEAACTVRTDQRGDPRPGIPGQNCDAGAFEYQTPTVTGSVTTPEVGITPSTSSITYGTSTAAFTVSITGATGHGAPVGSVTLAVDTLAVESTPSATTCGAPSLLGYAATYHCRLPAISTLSVGHYRLNVVFTHGVPSSTVTGYSYASTTEAIDLSVTKAAAPATAVLNGILTSVTYGSESQVFTGEVTGQHGKPSGVVEVNTTGGITLCSTTAISSGAGTSASFSCTQADASQLAVGNYTVLAHYSAGETTSSTPNYTYSAKTSTSQQLAVTRATPKITWATPASIPYGTPLGATQLNASASVAGRYLYTPPSGTVLSAGTHALRVTFTPTTAINYTTASDSVIVRVNEVAPKITSTATAYFTVGKAGAFTIASVGTPVATVSESGKLPTGVTFNATSNGTATISGTPAARAAGAHLLTITATNGVAPAATQSFTLVVDQAPAITSASSTTFTAEKSNSFIVETSGYPAGRISEEDPLPNGVAFRTDGNGTATISGTPTTSKKTSYGLKLIATNGVGEAATQTFTLTVASARAKPAHG